MLVAMETKKCGMQNVSKRWNEYGLYRRGNKKQEGPSVCGIKEKHIHLEEGENGRKAAIGKKEVMKDNEFTWV